MSDSPAPFILVDGSSYLFRAFHGMPPMSNSQGQATHAIYGVINMLKSLLNTYQPTHIGVVFDAKGKTFRDDIYPEYKANRPPMPDDLRSQIAPLHAIIKAMGLPLLVEDNVEADDVIGTLCKKASAKGIPTLVSTGDKDMAQLVNEHVTLINTMTNVVMDPAGVVEKFGVGPELIIDLLALQGDKVDNIPGVPGVGAKSALGLLQGIGGIEDIYNNLDQIQTLAFRGAKTLAPKMLQYEKEARLSYELATIAVDLDLPYEVTDLDIKTPDNNALAELYQTYEFKRWYKEVSGDNFTPKVTSPETAVTSPDTTHADTSAPIVPTVEQPPINRDAYEVVLSEAHLQQWIERCEQAPLFAIDTETTSLHYREAELVGISLCVGPNQACYIPVAHDYPGAPEQLPREQVLAQLKPLLENPKPQKIGHNIKYDQNVLANYDIALCGVTFDTMLLHFELHLK